MLSEPSKKQIQRIESRVNEIEEKLGFIEDVLLKHVVESDSRYASSGHLGAEKRDKNDKLTNTDNIFIYEKLLSKLWKMFGYFSPIVFLIIMYFVVNGNGSKVPMEAETTTNIFFTPMALIIISLGYFIFLLVYIYLKNKVSLQKGAPEKIDKDKVKKSGNNNKKYNNNKQNNKKKINIK